MKYSKGDIMSETDFLMGRLDEESLIDENQMSWEDVLFMDELEEDDGYQY